ncbi:MAG: hypothetical protein U5R31_11190 [Acidimicrobiia bacterium]|nr:hypothetical protein [Acidimicrobiia bacterium]
MPDPTTPPPTGNGGNPAPPPPPPPPDAPPADLDVFFADDGSGRLPVRKGQSSTVSIRNTGGSTGFWALNASGPVRVDGRSGVNGECAPGAVVTVRVTVAASATIEGASNEEIRFESADGRAMVVPVRVLPPI